MEFTELIRKRHSVRKFLSTPVESEKLAFILACTNLTPSAGDLRAYKIYTVHDPRKIKQIAQYSANQMFIAEAPIVLVFCVRPELSVGKYGERGVMYSLQDATIAAAYAQLAAVDMGLGSCWVGAIDGDKISEIVDIPIHHITPIAVMPIGYSADA